jgi:hypothetical protein
MPKTSWTKLNPKIAAALAAALALDGGTIIDELNGTITLREALVAVVGLDLPVLVGYLKSDAP